MVPMRNWTGAPSNRVRTLVEKRLVSLDPDFVYILARTAAEVTHLVAKLGSNRHATCLA